MAQNLKDIYTGVDKKDKKRRKNDFYPTPPLATYILNKYSTLLDDIVEPCAGRGNISVELQRCGHKVHSFDLYKYNHTLCDIEHNKDVLTLEKPVTARSLVTNPPYHKDLPRKIAEKGISEYEVTALLVRLTFLEGKKRKELFSKHPPSDILFFSDRIKFSTDHIEPVDKNDQIGGMIAYCWVVWNKRHKNTSCKWVTLEEEYEEWFRQYEASK